jgi:hypothetical protein
MIGEISLMRRSINCAVLFLVSLAGTDQAFAIVVDNPTKPANTMRAGDGDAAPAKNDGQNEQTLQRFEVPRSQVRQSLTRSLARVS